MVTNVPFYSFKDVSLKRTVPFIVIVAIALGIALIASTRRWCCSRCSVVYGLSGYAVYVWPQGQGQAGQRDRHLDRRARRAGPAPLTGRPRLGYIRVMMFMQPRSR